MSKRGRASIILQGDSREERLKNFISWFSEEDKAKWEADNYFDESDDDMTFEEHLSYSLDMIESDGFDIEDYSKVTDVGMLVRVHNPPEKPACEGIVAELQDCSHLAIAHYNKEHKTHFRDVHVLKANSEALCPYRYYITFQAFNPKGKQQTLFQARVNICFPLKLVRVRPIKFDKEIELVRIKPTKPNPVFPFANELSGEAEFTDLFEPDQLHPLLPDQCPWHLCFKYGSSIDDSIDLSIRISE